MELNTIAELIGSLGFPIFIAVYVLHIQNSTQKEMKESIDALKEAVTKLIDKLC